MCEIIFMIYWRSKGVIIDWKYRYNFFWRRNFPECWKNFISRRHIDGEKTTIRYGTLIISNVRNPLKSVVWLCYQGFNIIIFCLLIHIPIWVYIFYNLYNIQRFLLCCGGHFVKISRLFVKLEKLSPTLHRRWPWVTFSWFFWHWCRSSLDAEKWKCSTGCYKMCPWKMWYFRIL